VAGGSFQLALGPFAKLSMIGFKQCFEGGHSQPIPKHLSKSLAAKVFSAFGLCRACTLLYKSMLTNWRLHNIPSAGGWFYPTPRAARQTGDHTGPPKSTDDVGGGDGGPSEIGDVVGCFPPSDLFSGLPVLGNTDSAGGVRGVSVLQHSRN
jgi:hypothetical protein